MERRQAEQKIRVFLQVPKSFVFLVTWALGISLYLELFCFLSFITIVLRNLCFGTHRRNQKFVVAENFSELVSKGKRFCLYSFISRVHGVTEAVYIELVMFTVLLEHLRAF